MKYKSIIVPRGARRLSPPYSFRVYLYPTDSDQPIEIPVSCTFENAYRTARRIKPGKMTYDGRALDQVEVSMPIGDLRKRVVAQILKEEPIIESPIDVRRNGKRGEFAVYTSGFYYISDGAGNLTKKA